ncbi:MAG: alpha/beta hydrolase [Oscillospiraceae bacterium]|jgi:fermentation-respiration switch protein FrsA (DUF1100 family)|nr:alpha/beta hydrolase [Oscillospiraceae bacterium]
MQWVLGIILGLIGLLALAGLIGGYAGFVMALTRRETKVKLQEPEPCAGDRDAMRDEGKAYLFALHPEEVELKSRDGITLRGYYIPAEKPTNKLAVLSHGYRCDGPTEFGMFFRFYHETLGWNILLPDHRAHGRSDGKRMGFSALEWQDLLDWIAAYANRVPGEPRIALHGVSMGAAIVLNCNEHDLPPCVTCVVEDCGYTNGFEMMRLSARRDLNIKFEPIFWAYRMWYRAFNGLSLKRDADLIGNIAKLKAPTLFVHGEDDPFVPAEMGHRLYQAATIEKDCLFVPGATHAMCIFTDPESYQAKLLEWYGKHMEARDFSLDNPNEIVYTMDRATGQEGESHAAQVL